MGLNLDYGRGSTWIMDGAQPGLGTGLHLGLWTGLNVDYGRGYLDQGWGPTWTREGPDLSRGLDQGQGSTWTRHGVQPGPGTGFTLDQGWGPFGTHSGPI